MAAEYDQTTGDLARAVADDVRSAVMRKMALVNSPSQQVMIATAALSQAAAMAAGALCAVQGMRPDEHHPMDIAIEMLRNIKTVTG